jgi:hypothetical protein
VKGEGELQADKDHTYGFIDEYLEDIINTSKIYESTHRRMVMIIGFQNIVQMIVSV